jgi:hypothetical protein
MAKSKFEKSNGFGPIGLLFLALVLYVGLSLAIGLTTRGDLHCRAGYHPRWQFVPPAWECRS